MHVDARHLVDAQRLIIVEVRLLDLAVLERDRPGDHGAQSQADRRLDLHTAKMRDVMTHPCKSIGARELAAEAVLLMERHRITALPVVDDTGRLVGALNVHDLLRAGVM